MDSPRPTNAGDRTRESTRASSSEPSAPARSSHGGEHVDSPQRKKPRLDSPQSNVTNMSGSIANGDSSSSNTLSDPSSSSPEAPRSPDPRPSAQTPSKITINLRRSGLSTSPTDSVLGPVSERESTATRTHRSASEHTQPTAYMDATRDSSIMDRNSPPVVDIALDGDDNEDEEDGFIQVLGSSRTSDLIEQFPGGPDFGPEDAVKAMSAKIDDGNHPSLDISEMIAISNWLLEWLDYTVDLESRWVRIYGDNHSFWVQVFNLFNRILTKKFSFTGFKGLKSSREALIGRLLGAYIRLCGHYIIMDTRKLERHSPDEAPVEFTSMRTLKSLQNVFHDPENSLFWDQLVTRHSLRVGKVLSYLVEHFLEDPNRMSDALMRLVLLSSKKLSGQPHARTVLMSSSCLLRMIVQARRMCEPPTEDRESLQNAFDTSTAIQSEILATVEKQISALNVETYRELAETVSCIICMAATDLPDTARSAFDALDPKPNGVSSDEYPVVLRISSLFAFYWQLITKGRMELRAFGVDGLQRFLVDLWTTCDKQRDPRRDFASESVLGYAAEVLDQHRVINYLVSVESHPQLVARSGNVLGFALITQRWTHDMTDAVFDTISLSQDSRMIISIWELLQRCVIYAQIQVLDAFRAKMSDLPSHTYGEAEQCFLRLLFERLGKLGRDDQKDEQLLSDSQLVAAYDLCVKIMQEDKSDALPFTGSGQMTLLASDMLRELDRIFRNQLARKAIYLECIKAVAQDSSKSTGSIRAILTLFRRNRSEDGAFLCNDLGLPNIIRNDFFAHMDKYRSRARNDVVDQEFSTRLEMLTELSITDMEQTWTLEMDQKFWSHLVGLRAINNKFRDAAWNWLYNSCSQSHNRSTFMSGCVEQHLQHISSSMYTSDMFTHGLVEFTVEAVGYQLRLRPSDDPLDGPAAKLPLGNFLWEVVLFAPDDAVAASASGKLSALHTQLPIVRTLDGPAVAENHVFLVDRALGYLHHTAEKFTVEPTSVTSSISMHAPRQAESVSFVRALNFLRTFLESANTVPQLRVPLCAGKSPSPEYVGPSPTLQERVLLKYQLFAGPQQSDIQSVEFVLSATCQDLFQMLQRLSKFVDFRTISGGHQIDLLRSPSLPAASVLKSGLLVVKRIGDGVYEFNDSKASGFTTVAETTLLSHHEELYDLLSLEGDLGHDVFTFLQVFPPVGRLRESLFATDSSWEDLFPVAKPYKTLYSLQTLIRECDVSTCATGPEVASIVTSRLSAAFANSANCALDLRGEREDEMLTSSFCDAFLAVLRWSEGLIPREALNSDEVAIIRRLYKILNRLMNDPQYQNSIYAAKIESNTFALLLTLAARNEACTEAFRNDEECLETHRALLLQSPDWRVREQVRSSIERHVQAGSWTTKEQHCGSLLFYWQLVASLIAGSAQWATHSHDFFTLARTLVLAIDDISPIDTDVLPHLPEWLSLLVGSCTAERVSAGYRDEFTHGLAQLVSSWLTSKKHEGTLSDTNAIADDIQGNLLFPELSSTARAGEDSIQTFTCPVLDSDTRKALYGIVLALCRDSASLRMIVDRLKVLTDEATPSVKLLWDTDRALLLRSPAGFSGLRNLTNTCYMNSLIAQLFMNANFRKTILEARTTDDRGSQKLLSATQRLFENMQGSQRKFAETLDFASAIVPYDAPQIDIREQMDVDEFYNLLFDRWESQMLTKEEKTAFRGIYGGDVITQIKSLDCEHISERTEPYLAISCEVKGKAGLPESLSAYVQGDAMEGDNKYKCESCGGRFVNAVKRQVTVHYGVRQFADVAVCRSCLKSIPDNIVFHLKRFDFDLINLSRSKINQYFSFPDTIDMTHYHYDYLSDTGKEVTPDIFELVGVLVHVGTTDTGHYYSFIKSGTADNHQWNEFNDIEVNTFDPSKIPDQCFGGWDQHWGSYKSYNAYMLFYQRRCMPAEVAEAKQADPPSPSSAAQVAIGKSHSDIARENELLARMYCLLDPAHSNFVRDLLLKAKALHNGRCSEEHETEDAMVIMLLRYLHQVASRSRSTTIMETILDEVKLLLGCERCAASAIEWLNTNPSILGDFVLCCPSAKFRSYLVDLIMVAIVTVRNGSGEFEINYGLRSDMKSINNLHYDENGLLPRLVYTLLLDMPDIARFARTWNEYFALLRRIAELGRSEVALLLNYDVLLYCVQLVYLAADPIIDYVMQLSRFLETNAGHFRRYLKKQTPSFVQVVMLIVELFKHIHPWECSARTNVNRLEQFDEYSKTFGITKEEAAFVFRVEEGQYPFLTKIIDAWNEDNTPWLPGVMVARLLDTANDEDASREREVAIISMTIATAINEYYAGSVYLGLNTAVYFFEHCQQAVEARHILETASRNAAKDEAPVEGATAYLGFFGHVAGLRDVVCSEPDDPEPFLDIVLDTLEAWFPLFLKWGFQKVRLQALELIDILIFSKFPRYPIGDEDPSELDNLRCATVLILFNQCYKLFMQPPQRGSCVDDSKELYILLAKCDSWVRNLQHQARHTMGFSDLYDMNEKRYLDLLKRFRSASDRRAEQERDGDASGANTEEASGDEGFATNSTGRGSSISAGESPSR